jgi:hypothetical protein
MKDQQLIPEPRGLTRPLSLRGVPAWVVYFFSLVGLVYLLNPSFGVFELLPDNIPIIGNLDEGGAALLVWYGLVEFFEGSKLRRARKAAARALNKTNDR